MKQRDLVLAFLTALFLFTSPILAQTTPDPSSVSAETASVPQTASEPSLSPSRPSVASVISAEDYQKWEALVTRAEDAITAQRASNEAFLSLRQQIADFRQRFALAQGQNAELLLSLKEQLTALGPLPAEGTTEAAELATQRQALIDRTAELSAPGRAAEVAYTRADALIRSIDRVLRERQTGRLLELGPSPLNPVHWPGAITSVTSSISAVFLEITNAWRSPIQQISTRSSLPAEFLLTLLGAVLILRGGYWVERGSLAIVGDKNTPGRWLAGFGVSLGQVFVPVLGTLLIVIAAELSGLTGMRSTPIVGALIPLSFSFFSARWLGGRMFPKHEGFSASLNLASERRAEGRFHAATLGLIVGLGLFVEEVASATAWSNTARIVVLFPFMVTAALFMMRLAGLLSLHVRNEEEAQGERSYRNRLIHLLARLLIGLAAIGTIAAAVGYFEAGVAIVYPTIMSLQLLALLMVLQRVVTAVYSLVTRNEKDAQEALFPTLAGFIFALLSLPVFALIWGAKATDLVEIWGRFSSGVSIGETRISPAAFLTFAIVFTVGYMATRMLQGTLKSSVLPKTKIDTGGQNAIVAGTGYVGIFLAALVAVTSAGIDLSSLAIVAGALSVGIGFGLQNIVSNFVSGIILLIERPISEGDWIEVGGKQGYVRDISVRSTRIETFDRTDVIVPNADFVSGMVTNYTRGKTIGRVIIPVGVAYGVDTRKVDEILREIAEAHPMVLANPPATVAFMGFGADSLNFEIRVILRDVNWSLSVRSELNHRIYERFREEGIEIPFAQRDIWIKNPEALLPRGPERSQSPSPDPDARRDWAEQPEASDQTEGSMDKPKPEGNS
jgi:potassium-dependent mechanosensitive channel